MTTETITNQISTIIPVSEATKALVEQKLPEQSDEIKQKMGELVELIKKQAESELTYAESMTRETYINAISNAKATLKKPKRFSLNKNKLFSKRFKN